jgi:hypothetical protein
MHAAGGLFLPDLHEQLADLSRQVAGCLNLWSSYFALTQTRCHRLARGCIRPRQHLVPKDFLEHEQRLNELHRTVVRFQDQHQQAMDRVVKHYLQRFADGEAPSLFVPYVISDQADTILVAISAMYYSTTELARAALSLGTTIQIIFELETTRLYRQF